MFLIDTNVLIYAANVDCAEHAACSGLVERARRGRTPWYTTWPILYEFLRVMTHPRVLTEPWAIREAWTFIVALLASPSLILLTQTSRHADVAGRTLQEIPLVRGNLLHDCHAAVLMREHGIRRIYTRDADFQRFPFLEALDPLSASESSTEPRP
jgi:hypothetical protein